MKGPSLDDLDLSSLLGDLDLSSLEPSIETSIGGGGPALGRWIVLTMVSSVGLWSRMMPSSTGGPANCSNLSRTVLRAGEAGLPSVSCTR